MSPVLCCSFFWLSLHNLIKFFLVSMLQMDDSAGIEAEFHHKNNRVSFAW